MRRARAAVLADVLTFSRLAVAVALIPAAGGLRLGLTSTLVSIAWLTDLLDGRIARAAGVEGRMGHWDLTADTMVGAALLAGLAAAGQVPFVAAVIVIAGLGAWFLVGNYAAALLLQLAGYVPLLVILWMRRPAGWWLPYTTATLIGIVDWRRLITVNIPGFVGGLIGRDIGPISRRGTREQ